MTTKLDELKALMAKATRGPWTQMLKPSPSREDHGWRAMAMCGSKQMIAAPYSVAFECWDNEANASLITNAVNALPALIAAIAALQEISKGAGEFDMDPLEHAKNCIHDMKAIARAALAPFGENDEQN